MALLKWKWIAKAGCLGLVLLLVAMLIMVGAVFAIFKNKADADAAATTAGATGTFSAAALKTIPANYIAAYQAASAAYGIPATFLAAIAQVESTQGTDPNAGAHQPSCSAASPCHMFGPKPDGKDPKALANWAGAAGPMQIGIGGASTDNFSHGHSWGGEWDSVWHGAIHPVPQEGCAANNPGDGVDGNGDGLANVYDIADAACAAAKQLVACWDKSLEHLWQAAYGYNHGCAHNLPDSVRTSDGYTKLVMQSYTQFTDWTVPVSFSGNASTLGVAAVQMALRQLGKPYVWGADGPNSFDCSGLTFYAYKQVDFNWTRMTAAGQLQWLRAHGGAIPLNMAIMQPGDLVFYGSSSDPHHVEMYMGNGQMVEAPHTGDVVKVVSFPGGSDAVAAGRPAMAIH